jgi:hypothetical protein
VNNVKLSDKLDRLAWDLALDELPLKGAVLVLRDELAHEARELEARADGVDRVVLVPEAPIPTDLFPPLPGEPPQEQPKRRRGPDRKKRAKITPEVAGYITGALKMGVPKPEIARVAQVSKTVVSDFAAGRRDEVTGKERDDILAGRKPKRPAE